MRRPLLLASLLGLTAAAPTTSSCTRAALQALADSYVAAQKAGSAASLSAASSTAYTENLKTTPLASGILSKALPIDHNRTTIDTTQCATYTELISASGPVPYVIGTQIRYDDAGTKIVGLDSIVTTKGDWLFNATGTLYWAAREDWGVIPEQKRDSRAVIQAAADAYCDIFNNKTVTVPWGTPCARLEGGSYTGSGKPTDSCNVGIPSGVPITERRYVVDEVLGAVDVLNRFTGIPDTHEFRVEGGRLRYVHTMTVTGKH